jgi:hypothetical protein
MGRSSGRYRPPSPSRGATDRAFPRSLFYDDVKASAHAARGREREERGGGAGPGLGRDRDL